MLKRHLLMNSATAGLVLALALTGCGGSAGESSPSGGEASSSEKSERVANTISGEEEATDETAKEEAVEEETLTAADVAGYYMSDEDDNTDKGLFTVYRFKKSGVFQMAIYAYDAPYVREGTFEMRGNKAIINVPEGESFEIQGVTFKANAIVDGEITFDGDHFMSNDIGSKTLRASKISKAEFEDHVARAAAAGPSALVEGEPVTTDSYTFTINSFEFKDEVYPSDTSGYYRYWEHQDDSDYLVADITYTNNGTDYTTPGYSTAAQISVGENNYQATIEVDGGSRTSQSYSIEAKETNRIIILAAIPNAAREEGGELKLLWSFPKDGSRLNYYYDSDDVHITYKLTK